MHALFSKEEMSILERASSALANCLAISDHALARYYLAPYSSIFIGAERKGIVLPRQPDSLRCLHEFIDRLGYSCDRFEIKLRSPDSSGSLLIVSPTNIYERLSFRIAGVIPIEIEFVRSNTNVDYLGLEPWSKLMEFVRGDSELRCFFSCIPIALLSKIVQFEEDNQRQRFAEVKVLILNPRVALDEDYSCLVARLKAKGVKIIGMPHGAFYCQTPSPSRREICERYFADLFVEPNWLASRKKRLPNFRASKNLFISKKLRIKTLLTNVKFYEVAIALPYFETGQKSENEDFYDIGGIAATLQGIWRACAGRWPRMGLKIHPRNLRDKNELARCISAFDRTGWFYFIVDGSCRDLLAQSASVIFLSALSTGLLESIGTKCEIFVVLHDNDRVNAEYRQFLLNNARPNGRLGGSCAATLLELRTGTFRKAYSATYFYAIRWALAVRRESRNESKWL